MNAARERLLDALRAAGSRVSNDGRAATCPAHDDRQASLSIGDAREFAGVLVNCHAGCRVEDVLSAVKLKAADLFDSPPPGRSDRVEVARYPYVDLEGTVAFEKVRYFPKDFRTEPPGVVGKLPRKPLYRLPDVARTAEAGGTVWLVEGEKDADRLATLGVVATCNYDGAAGVGQRSKWRPEYADQLAGAHVVIVADRDDPGRAHARAAADGLAGRARSVRIVESAAGKDVSDHLDAGHDLGDLVDVDAPADDVDVEARQWPILDAAAYQGAAGRIVKMVAPYTEADPAAVLVTLLSAVGAVVGAKVHMLGGNDEHPARVWTLIVGKTSSGAKGTSHSLVRSIVLLAAPEFGKQLEGGLSSGEGLIERVRDAQGDTPEAQADDTDAPTDRRLLVIETEYASVLARQKREGSSLGYVLRQAWDGAVLSTLNRKANRLRATGASITVIGHITPGELSAKLEDSDVAGGGLNRFLPILSRRSRLLPDGGNLPGDVKAGAVTMVKTALSAAAKGRREWTPAARTRWHAAYATLAADRPDSRLTSATARAVPQVMRLALAFSILDSAPAVDVDHLEAALAVWDYAFASAAWLFSTAEDAEGDRLIEYIASGGPAGRSQSEIHREHYRGHKTSDQVAGQLRPLIESGQVEKVTVPTKGRSKTTYVAKKAKERTKPVTSTNTADLSSQDAKEDEHPPVNPQVSGLVRNFASFAPEDPTGDLYACPECGKPVQPGTQALANGWRTVCADCDTIARKTAS